MTVQEILKALEGKDPETEVVFVHGGSCSCYDICGSYTAWMDPCGDCTTGSLSETESKVFNEFVVVLDA